MPAQIMGLETALDGSYSGKYAFAYHDSFCFGHDRFAQIYVCLFHDESRDEDIILPTWINLPIESLPYVPDNPYSKQGSKDYFFYPEAAKGYSLDYVNGRLVKAVLAGRTLYESGPRTASKTALGHGSEQGSGCESGNEVKYG